MTTLILCLTMTAPPQVPTLPQAPPVEVRLSAVEKDVAAVKQELADLKAALAGPVKAMPTATAKATPAKCADCGPGCDCTDCPCPAGSTPPDATGEWRWASLPGVGPGWVHSSVPAAAATAAAPVTQTRACGPFGCSPTPAAYYAAPAAVGQYPQFYPTGTVPAYTTPFGGGCANGRCR